jgi:ubiquinone biosynthesis protein
MANLLPVPWFARGRLLRRSREIASSLGRHGLGWLVVQVGLGGLLPFERGWLGHPAQAAPFTQAEHLRMTLGELGATFIKLGQVLSTRPDLVPPEYVAQLAKLQDAAPPVPFEQISEIVYAELGQPPETLFAAFDPQPMASASIGQVHAAQLKTGHAVVVKVQRPGVAEQVARDLEILAGMAAWAEARTDFGRDYNVAALVEEFAFSLRNELDYRREGQNADRFRRNLAGDSGAHIPRVYWEFSTERVLTLERVSGLKIADMQALDTAGIDRHALAQNAVRLMLREVFEFGFFHADPHPGNFFVHPDGAIALIDFGMVGRLDDRLQTALLRVGLAVARQDAGRLADVFYELGVAGGRVRREVLQRDLDHFLSRYAGRSIKELAAGQTVSEIMAVALRHRLQLPSELVMLLRVVSMSEGLGAQLDPDFRLFDFASPYLQQFWLAQRSPKALTLRTGQAALDAAELALELPRRGARLLGQIERGELSLNVKPDGLREFTHELQRMTNRLALMLLLAATIVALGLAMVVYHPPGWDQYGGWLFGLAFLLSLAFGGWLMWTIWLSGRR